MYWVKPPIVLRKFLPQCIWEGPDKNKIYLTFDDGPFPDSTPNLVDILAELKMQASFFLLGQNAIRYLECIDQIRANGHTVGHHGYNHLSGWSTRLERYLENTLKGSETLQSKLFRPPYGRITPNQYQALKNKQRIVMWSIMPGDFNKNTSAQDCFKRIQKNISGGDIIVLHEGEDLLNKNRDLLYMLSKEYGNVFSNLDMLKVSVHETLSI